MERFAPAIFAFYIVTFAFATVAFHGETAASRAQEKFLAPPPDYIEHMTLGFAESVADGLWLRWIQDGDGCQTYGVAPASTLDVPSNLAREFNNPRRRACDNSWSYKMLDGVTRIAPKFKMPYLAGTMTLAILVEDYEGTTKLFDRAVENYPDDWQILYRAAYHYLFDLKELPRAADLLDRAATHGAPGWVNLLSARINTRAGRAVLGLSTLKRYLESLTDPEARQNVEKRIADLERELHEAPRPDGP